MSWPFEQRAQTWLERYVWRQRAWSSVTFGRGRRTVGITRHIEKECEEIRQNPDDLEEWIDVIILAMDGYWRAGGTPDTLEWHLRGKQETNFGRRWPAPQSEDEPTEHVK